MCLFTNEDTCTLYPYSPLANTACKAITSGTGAVIVINIPSEHSPMPAGYDYILYVTGEPPPACNPLQHIPVPPLVPPMVPAMVPPLPSSREHPTLLQEHFLLLQVTTENSSEITL